MAIETLLSPSRIVRTRCDRFAQPFEAVSSVKPEDQRSVHNRAESHRAFSTMTSAIKMVAISQGRSLLFFRYLPWKCVAAEQRTALLLLSGSSVEIAPLGASRPVEAASGTMFWNTECAPTVTQRLTVQFSRDYPFSSEGCERIKTALFSPHFHIEFDVEKKGCLRTAAG